MYCLKNTNENEEMIRRKDNLNAYGNKEQHSRIRLSLSHCLERN